MPIASDDLRLFGLDLRNLWHDLRRPWEKLARAADWGWLSPRVEVQVIAADQDQSVWEPDRATRGFRLQSSGPAALDGAAKANYRAMLLPESLLLRKRLVMPLLDAEKMQQALALEALNSNPFANSGLVWGYALRPDVPAAAQDSVTVDMAMASRQGVEQFLATQSPSMTNSPEVWALAEARSDRAMLMAGFGEDLRARQERRHWTSIGILCAMVLGLGIAMAVTPFLQLRARVMQANVAYAAVDRQAAPQIAKREALLRAEDQVKALADIIGHRLDPLQVIQMLTNALPDDTVLRRLQMEGRKVSITGQAADTATLMQKLGAIPQVREVRAPSAAVRQPGMTKESFQIEFQLTEEFGVSAADSATAAALAPATAAIEASSAASVPAAAASAPASPASVASAVASPAAVPASVATGSAADKTGGKQ